MPTTIIVGTIALVVLSVVFLVLGAVATGGSSHRPVPGWLTERPFAHRGLHDRLSRPENSLAAFDAAASAGYGVELDVHLSKDGIPIVIHDDDLLRVTGDPRKASEVRVAELAAIPLIGSEERIPTLRQALIVIDSRVPVLIEVKNPEEIGPLEDAVSDAIADYEGDIAIMSFNPFIVAHFRQSSPGTLRGQLSSRLKGEDVSWYERIVLRTLMMNWKSRPDFVAYDLNAMPSPTTFMQRLRGRTLLAWTVDNAADAAKAERIADNVIANPGGLPR